MSAFLYKPDRPMIRDERGWNAQQPHLYPMLGLKPGAHLPAEGIPPRIIQGVKVWVEPAKPAFIHAGRKLKSSVHRVMAECPLCKKVMSAGRMHQHNC